MKRTGRHSSTYHLTFSQHTCLPLKFRFCTSLNRFTVCSDNADKKVTLRRRARHAWHQRFVSSLQCPQVPIQQTERGSTTKIYIYSNQPQVLKNVIAYKIFEASAKLVLTTRFFNFSCLFPSYLIIPFKDEAQTALFTRPSPYRAVSTSHLGYKNESIYDVSGASRCLFRDTW